MVDPVVGAGPALLRLQHLTKRFGAFVADDDVSMDVMPGEVHALLGENGAGKSTLMKMLYGLYQPDEGRILVNGQPTTIRSPSEAVMHGIGMVHQQFMLVPNLTALENVVLGMKSDRAPLLSLPAARERLLDLGAEYGLDIDPDAEVWQLSVGAQQRLEILKAIFRGARLLVLDEPTAVLAPAEVEGLFRVMRTLASEGRGIIFISHKLSEVTAVSDRITVLRRGRVTGDIATRDADPHRLAVMMLGREVSIDRVGPPVHGGAPVLEIAGLHCQTDQDTPGLVDVNLTVRSGEIVGVAGVDGNGQRELVECIAGLRKTAAGKISISGESPNKALRRPGLLGLIPEDRTSQGLVGDFEIAENLVLRAYNRPPYSSHGFLAWSTIRQNALSKIEAFGIQCSGPRAPVKTLSGGNQQKVIIARETAGDPALLLAAQPTRGLDVGAVSTVLDELRRQRDRGAAVLLVSTELNELLAVSDRLIVLHKGEVMGEVSPDSSRLMEIGQMMMGQRSTAGTGPLKASEPGEAHPEEAAGA